MTPKEKAVEIVDKMYMSTEWLKEENYNPLQEYQRIKKCALIALRETVWGYLDQQPIEIQNYWQEVKQEIEKL
jgi:hypothetical protein